MSTINKYSIGCDIGGSHISCGIINIASGKIEKNSLVSVKVDNATASEVILDAWAMAIEKCKIKLSDGVEFAGVGLAIPGPFDYHNGIALYDNSNQKFVHLKDVNVKKELSERLELVPSKIKFTNDATAFALGSFWYGSGKGFQKLVAITLGTGFGSAFIANGIAVEEGNTVPKEGCLWHLPYKDGIADDYFSTRWFVNSFNAVSDEQVSGVKRIAEMVKEGNEKASELFRIFGENLADCLAEPLKNFEAEVVVMGGNIAEAFGLFEEDLQKNLQSKGINVPFKVSILKESAAMLGAVTVFK